MKAYNIQWDTDGDKEVFEELPQEVEIPERFSKENYLDIDGYDEETRFDDISDYLSYEYGFCHAGFEFDEEDYNLERNI